MSWWFRTGVQESIFSLLITDLLWETWYVSLSCIIATLVSFIAVSWWLALCMRWGHEVVGVWSWIIYCALCTASLGRSCDRRIRTTVMTTGILAYKYTSGRRVHLGALVHPNTWVGLVTSTVALSAIFPTDIHTVYSTPSFPTLTIHLNSSGSKFFCQGYFHSLQLLNVPQFLFCWVVRLKLLHEVISAIINRYVTWTISTNN